MNKTKYTPENSCVGKVRYANISEANVHVKRFNQESKYKKVKAYSCNHCGGYHYGHESHKRMKHQDKPGYIPDYDESEIKRNKTNTGSTGDFLNIKTNNL